MFRVAVQFLQLPERLRRIIGRRRTCRDHLAAAESAWVAWYNLRGGRTMPLRDHFRPPVTDLASWEELHGAWPSTIAYRLNALLPPEYRSGVKIHLGSAVEIDVAAFELQNPGGSGNDDPSE